VEEHEQAHFHDKISQCLSVFMDRLPAPYREALQMVELQQMSQLDFARKLNISYSGARSRTQRAREKLKAMLLDCCWLEVDLYGNVMDAIPKKSCPVC
jgi:RNA polymerase sigma-70 factor, ECF subfamily